MEIETPFAIMEGAAGATQNSRETLINMYAEIVQGGTSQIVRRQRPGVENVQALAGEKRCIEKFGDIHYLIAGATFYSFDGATLTTLGTLNTSSGKCSMIYNDNAEIMISDGATGYYWNGSTLAVITPPAGMDGFGTLAFLGGFGIIGVPGSDRFYTTPSNDFSQVDGADFATAESAPDPIVRVFVDHNELWLAGTGTTEIWQQVSASFPFQPLANAKLERGCAAPFSFAAEDNSVFFLGDDGIVYRADGYRPVVVSTRPVEDLIAGLSKADAHAMVYTTRGNKFYTLIFPGQLTLQYNITTGLWNRDATYPDDDWQIMSSHGHHADYVLTATGIGRLVDGLCTDDGGIMLRTAVSAPGYALGRRITVNNLFLDAEVGRADIGVEANVMLRMALDGETFGNQRVRSLGPTGDYRRRAVWRGLGQGRSPVIEVSISDPVEFKIMSAIPDVSIDG